jgi:hypothetical protein
MPTHPQADLLPSELRLLCVSQREPSWTNLALHLNEWGCHEPRFRWRRGTEQVLSLLREESFDCVVIGALTGDLPVTDDELTAFLEVVGADGSQTPLLVLSDRMDDELLLRMSRLDCGFLATGTGWRSPALAASIGRTMRRFELMVEHQKISTAELRRSVRERDEAESLLEQQRRILTASDRCCARETPDGDLPEEINTYYQELLRTYIIMGSGNLEDDIGRLAELFALTGVGPRAALRLHLERVESMVRGLGSRSARHVMARADILAMELIIELGECFRRRSALRGLGDFGVDLLHAETVRNKR